MELCRRDAHILGEVAAGDGTAGKCREFLSPLLPLFLELRRNWDVSLEFGLPQTLEKDLDCYDCRGIPA